MPDALIVPQRERINLSVKKYGPKSVAEHIGRHFLPPDAFSDHDSDWKPVKPDPTFDQ